MVLPRRAYALIRSTVNQNSWFIAKSKCDSKKLDGKKTGNSSRISKRRKRCIFSSLFLPVSRSKKPFPELEKRGKLFLHITKESIIGHAIGYSTVSNPSEQKCHLLPWLECAPIHKNINGFAERTRERERGNKSYFRVSCSGKIRSARLYYSRFQR